MTTGKVKNWAAFQHYKDRSPPWIKLHRELLDDFTFTSLPLASKALAPMLWLLAAETQDGTVSLDAEWLAWRLRIALDDVVAGLTPLIEKGFLIPASKALAKRKHVAIPEGEGEGEGETEGETERETEGDARKRRAKTCTLTDWIAELGDNDAVPADDPIFDWAAKVGIPRDWIALAWWAFEGRYTGDGQGRAKTYADWRATFRNAVREDWLKLWRAGADGFVLTTVGQTAQLEMRP